RPSEATSRQSSQFRMMPNRRVSAKPAATASPPAIRPRRGRRRAVASAFHVEMIKPSHYDDDGYVIQWWKASIPSNSLASLYAIVQDAADRRVLGDGIALTYDGWDECNTIISEDRVARRIAEAGNGI